MYASPSGSSSRSSCCLVRLWHEFIDRIRRAVERVFRSCIFPLTALKNGEWLDRRILGFYRGCLDRQKGTKWCCIPPPIDDGRMKASLECFKLLGGTIDSVRSKDGAKVWYCHVTRRQFEDRIEACGAKWEAITLLDGQKCWAIVPVDEKSEKWKSFSKNCLSKFGFEAANYKGKLVFVTSHRYREKRRSESCCTIHSTTFARSFVMNRKRAGFYLGMMGEMGDDAAFCMYDYPGIFNSTGESSKESCYNASEAVLDEMLKHHKAKDIWCSGLCLGAMAAAHQKAYCPDVNFCGENMPSDVPEDLNNSGVVWRIIRWCLKKIPALHFKVEWSKSGLGKVVVMRTSNDTFIRPEAMGRIGAAAKGKFPSFRRIIRVCKKGEKGGHFADPLFAQQCRVDLFREMVSAYSGVPSQRCG